MRWRLVAAKVVDDGNAQDPLGPGHLSCSEKGVTGVTRGAVIEVLGQREVKCASCYASSSTQQSARVLQRASRRDMTRWSPQFSGRSIQLQEEIP